MANKTLNQILIAEPTLFNGLVVPSGMDAATVVRIITDMSGPLFPYLQDAAELKTDITAWSTYRSPEWAKAYAALTQTYNPLHNYYKEELGSEKNSHHKGTKRSRNEDIEETPATITNTGSVVAYDTSSEAETGKSVVSPGTTKNTRQAQAATNYETETDIDANTYDNDTLEFINRVTQGNIGVTKSQDMARDEVNLRFEIAIYERIAAEFENKFMIQVY